MPCFGRLCFSKYWPSEDVLFPITARWKFPASMRWPGLLPGLVKQSSDRQWPGEPLLPDSGTCRTSGVLKIADSHPLLFLCVLGWPGLTILGDPSSSGTYTHEAELGASFLATQSCVLFTQLGCFLNLYIQSSHVPKPSKVSHSLQDIPRSLS